MRAVAVALGLVLIVAAGLKLAGFRVSPLPGLGWLSIPGVQLTVVAAELAVGGWLLAGVARPFAWLAAIGLFSVFAVVSGYFGFLGQASCGCFGAIDASPWAAFAIDLVAVAALLIARPSRESWRAGNVPPLIRKTSQLLGGAAVALLLLALGGTLAFGSVSAALAKLRGESLSADSYLDFGTGKPGEKLERKLTVTNWTANPVRLIGGTSDCSCVTTSAMPLTVPPGGTVEVAVRMTVPASDSGGFTRTGSIWTDCDAQRTLRFVLGCLVD